MSRTNRGEKGPGYDYWTSRLPGPCGMIPGRQTKKWTARHERRKDKDKCRDPEEVDDVGGERPPDDSD